MEKMRSAFLQSVITLIHLSLVAIIAITLLSIFFSFWITEKSDNEVVATLVRRPLWRRSPGGSAVSRREWRGNSVSVAPDTRFAPCGMCRTGPVTTRGDYTAWLQLRRPLRN